MLDTVSCKKSQLVDTSLSLGEHLCLFLLKPLSKHLLLSLNVLKLNLELIHDVSVTLLKQSFQLFNLSLVLRFLFSENLNFVHCKKPLFRFVIMKNLLKVVSFCFNSQSN